MKRRALLLLALALTLGGVTRADIGFTNFGSSGGGCSADCTLTGTTTVARLAVAGTVPTSCAVTGAGAAGSCTLVAGSTDSAGFMEINTDTSGTAATGTLTLVFSAALGGADPVCMPVLMGAGVAWTTTSTIRQGAASSATQCSWTWNNTSALTADDTYQVGYIVIGQPAP